MLPPDVILHGVSLYPRGNILFAWE